MYITGVAEKEWCFLFSILYFVAREHRILKILVSTLQNKMDIMCRRQRNIYDPELLRRALKMKKHPLSQAKGSIASSWFISLSSSWCYSLVIIYISPNINKIWEYIWQDQVSLYHLKANTLNMLFQMLFLLVLEIHVW